MIKKKKWILWILAGIFGAIMCTIAVFYIIYLVQYNYPDYVSAWRQDSQSISASFPVNLEFFRNGSCKVDGVESNYKFSKNTVRIGEKEYGVSYDTNHMTLSSASGSASYESTGSSERYRFRIENGEAVIEHYNGYQQIMVVPDRLGDVPVTKIESLHSYSLVCLTLPNSITAIGSRAFWLNDNMEEIILPESLVNIADGTFEKCSKLKHIVIPEGVVSIGKKAFAECTALESVDLPESLRSIGESAFEFCPKFQSVSLPNHVTVIHDYAFRNCVALESVAFPIGLTVIGTSAFWNCAALKEITLPTQLSSLGSAAFFDCESLERVVLSGSVSVLEGSVFDSCSALKRIVIPNGVTTIDDYAFAHCSALESVLIPKTLSNLSAKAFEDCSRLAGLTIVTDNSAYVCRNNALLSVDGKTFCYYFDGSHNSSYIVPAGVETIENGAFAGCTYLQHVIIPEGVTTIEYNAIDGCKTLRSISLPASVADCSYAVTRCYALNNVTISPQNSKYSIRNGVLLNKSGLYLYNCLYGVKDGALVLPEGIAHIFGNPYENIADLKSVWLPKSLVDIGMERGNTALGSESYLKQNGITIYAWRGSDAFKAAMKYGIDVIARKD